MVIKAGPRLRDSASWLPLAAGAISRNLGPVFFYHPCAFRSWKSEKVNNEPVAVGIVVTVADDVAVEVAALPFLDGGVVCCPLEDRFLPFRPTSFRFSFF